jgi:6,7-dimethyl-8-ribityllumazine synthase
MGTSDLSGYDPASVPDAARFKFGIVVAEWNPDITESLLEGAVTALIKHGAIKDNIVIKHVPGSFELTHGAQILAEYYEPDAVICIGCVIQGETPHFTYICQSVTQGITQLNLEYDIPFIFGVLTTLNQQQAMDRAGGKHGNKGIEAAITAIKMATLQNEVK